MNCLAHAYRFLDDPYFVAGTGLPDWLSMADRKTRVRRREVDAFLQAPDLEPLERSLGLGIVQHMDDDDWFHVTPAFASLNQWLSGAIASCMGTQEEHRTGFLAHVAVELLLDSALAEAHPTMLNDYYRVLRDVDVVRVQQAVNRMARRPTHLLPWFMERWMGDRFMDDYLEDRPLVRRLSGVRNQRDALLTRPGTLAPTKPE